MGSKDKAGKEERKKPKMTIKEKRKAKEEKLEKKKKGKAGYSEALDVGGDHGAGY